MPIVVFTMDRSRCSRCADLAVHVGPIWAFTMDRNPHPANTGRGIHCEGPRCVAQVKERRSLSLAALTRLALDAQAEGEAPAVRPAS